MSKVKRALEELLTEHFEEHVRHWVYDGFETFEDYVKYGEMFVHAEPRQWPRRDMRLSQPPEYTPYTRQLTQDTIKP